MKNIRGVQECVQLGKSTRIDRPLGLKKGLRWCVWDTVET